MRQYITLFLAIFFLTPAPSRADMVWSFEILNPIHTIGEHDSVDIIGKILNSPSSTEALSIAPPCEQLCIAPVGSIIGGGGYDYVSSVFSLQTQPLNSLYGMTLQPGESYSFSFYTLTPLLPETPAGIYEISFNSLWVSSQVSQSYSNGGAVQINVVPLIPSFIGMLSSLSVLFGLRIKRDIH